MESPTISVLLAAGVEPTLDKWLEFNDATEVFDAELLEILPVEFHSDYEDRLRLNAEYEAKFANQSYLSGRLEMQDRQIRSFNS
jgi:hypothetical protein